MNSEKLKKIERFAKERNEALFSLDEQHIKAFLRKYGLPVTIQRKCALGSNLQVYHEPERSPGRCKKEGRAWGSKN